MYYPKSKIKESLYTSGNEFVDKTTQQIYVGKYTATFDGKYFTENRKELVKINTGKSQINTPTSIFHLVQPTDEDYKKGVITRYFIKRVNGGPDAIKEVNESDYNRFKREVLYITLSIPWKISGEQNDRTQANITIHGIIDTNQRIVKSKEMQMPGIIAYLQNLAEFSKIIL